MKSSSIKSYGAAILLMLGAGFGGLGTSTQVARGEDLSQYGREWESIQSEWNAEKARHANRIAEIEKQFPEGPRRAAAIEAENARHMNKSRELGARRNAIHQKVIEEANRRTSGGQSEASKSARQTAGTKPGEKGYRGMPGDLDAGAGARTTDVIDDVLKDMGIKAPKKVHAGTVEYGGDFNLTINKEGAMGRAGSGAHQTQIGVDARNPETYVSEGMANGQPGKKAVEVQDHIKKGADALNAPPEKVANNPDMQQKMAKTAHKVMNTGTVSDSELAKILKESGINETPQEFRDRMERIKEGRAKPGDITPENAGKLQEATRRIAETATETSGKMAEAEMKSARDRIAELERSGTPEAKAEAQKLREQLVDSKTRLEESKAANREKLGGSGDVDGPGRVTDADGPGRGPRDVDGPGRVTDVDGAGVKGGGPEAPGKLQQAGKVVGDYMEGVMILEQAEKIRDGIKSGDPTKVAQGLAGDDLGKRTEMQGAKDFADEMGKLEQAKKTEADMAEVSKLKRMGATPQEIADYEKAKAEGDLTKAREIAHGVRDRGGKDPTPEKGGLEGVGPEESGWDAKDQITEGIKQAGSYLEWGANVLSGGFTGKGQAAVEDANEITGLADNVDQQTKEQVRINMINKLAGTGEMSVEEAKKLVDQLEKGNREEFDRVVGELKEKGAFEKTQGKHGLTPNEGVDIPETDYTQEAKDTAHGLKETFVDKPGKIIAGIAEDALEATVGSDLYDTKDKEAQTLAEVESQKQAKYEGLIREGATPEQAKAAIEGPMGSVNKLLKELRDQKEREKDKQEKEKEEQAEGKDTKTTGKKDKGGSEQITKSDDADKEPVEKSESEKIADDIFDSPEPPKSEPQDFAEVNQPPSPSGPVNDAGQQVAPDSYDEGDTVVTSDGTEWAKQDGQWVKTGNNYGPYKDGGLKDAEPESEPPSDSAETGESGAGGGLDDFVTTRGEHKDSHTKGSYGLMSGQKEIADASSSSDQAGQEAKGLLNAAGADAQSTGQKSASATAAGDRENSWGKAIGDGIQQGIEKGLTSAAETFGSRGADKVSNEIFKPPKTESGQGSGGSSGGSADQSGGAAPPAGDSKSGQKGGPPAPPKGGGGGGGGQKIAKGTPPANKPPPAPHHCPKCGRTDLVKKEYEYTDPGSGQRVGVTEWRCPVCNVVGKLGPPPPGLGQKNGKTPAKLTKNCPQCGQPMVAIVEPTDPKDFQNPAAYQWMCMDCGSKSSGAAAKAPPAAPPKPPEQPKGYKCPVCGSYNTQFLHSHPLYGNVYKCHSCGNHVHNVY